MKAARGNVTSGRFALFAHIHSIDENKEVFHVAHYVALEGGGYRGGSAVAPLIRKYEVVGSNLGSVVCKLR